MSDDELGEILDALESSGLAEVYLDDEGREVMRLTDEGAALAQELGILEHGGVASGETGEAESPTAVLDMRNSWGSALGAAMLGFEQALRSGPPPEIQAAEHVPERGLGGEDEDVIIEFPEDGPPRGR